ncbi:MAG: UDP-N-acetylmuramate dehydrogenase [Bacteroidales bacterium]|nr:UDP-N-acetylmuramate dehydrogenase [Bacteroidales bacterium]
MLKIHKNHSLKNNNTFGVDIASAYFAEPQSADEIKFALEYAQERNWNYYVTGEGSNLLYVSDYDGLIIRPRLNNIAISDESASEILLNVQAGVNWDQFVSYCVSNNWYGTENLSLIPGSVGAAPVQNIGAYGTEAKEIIEFVEALDTRTMKIELLSNNNCQFGYRDSIFKRSNDRYIVLGVTFRLQKNGTFRLDYGNLKEEFSRMPDQTLADLRETVINIRRKKLPDPSLYGNAGSFFKNPVVHRNLFESIRHRYGKVPHYEMNSAKIKIPAAWLIEKAGWKGKRHSNVGTWPTQPLVIVNYGNASGIEIYEFSEMVRQSVLDTFNIHLLREVTLIDISEN